MDSKNFFRENLPLTTVDFSISENQTFWKLHWQSWVWKLRTLVDIYYNIGMTSNMIWSLFQITLIKNIFIDIINIDIINNIIDII